MAEKLPLPAFPLLYITLLLCLLRFLRDELVVYGGQVVSLVSVHGRGSVFDTCGLLHFSLVQVGFTGHYTRNTSA